MANAAPDAEALVEAGLALYGQGHLDEALSKWRAALLIEPTLALALEYISYVEENRRALEATFAESAPSEAAESASESTSVELPEPESVESASESTSVELPEPESASSEPESAPSEPESVESPTPESATPESAPSESAPSEADAEDRTSNVLAAEGLTASNTEQAEEQAAEEQAAEEQAAEEQAEGEQQSAFGSDDSGWEEPPTTGGSPSKPQSAPFEIQAEAPKKDPAGPLSPKKTREVPSSETDGGVSAQVDVLSEVGWDDLLSDDEPAPESAEADLTPRIDVDELKKQAAVSPARPGDSAPAIPIHAKDDQTRPLDPFSRPARRERRATPLTFEAHGESGFAPSEATPHVLSQDATELGSAAAAKSEEFTPATRAELDANDATPGGEDRRARAASEVAGRPTTRHLSASSNKALEPEQVFSASDSAELVADDATPASMIRRGHAPPRADRPQGRQRSPAAPPSIPVAVPPPVPRSAKHDKRLELKAEEGFVGLDDLLTSDEERALEAAEPANRRRESAAEAARSSGPGADALVAEAFGSSPGSASRPGGKTGPRLPPVSGGSASSADAGPADGGGGLEGLAREADSFADDGERPSPAEGEERLESMLAGAQQLYDQGTFEGSLWLCQKVLSLEPTEATAQELLRRNQEVLLRQYERQLVDLGAVPVIQIPQQEIVWHKLDHRAGFLLSRVDGMLCYDDILDISGMARFEACRILAQLVEQGVIGVSR